MRYWLITVLVALCAGCPASVGRETLTDDTGGDGAGSGSGGGQSTPAECFRDIDCVPAGPKCCDCPTHAVPATDPSQMACSNVDCAPASCGSPMRAACDVGTCVLECAPVACDPSVSCSTGFATDANGCLTCECAVPASLVQCDADADCVRVRADCCGCAMGGEDTSVATTEAAAHDAALMCPTNPSCPAVDTCAADLAPRCVQGSCALVTGLPPGNACGRADLPPCTAGESCYVNADDQASMYGVGVCQP